MWYTLEISSSRCLTSSECQVKGASCQQILRSSSSSSSSSLLLLLLLYLRKAAMLQSGSEWIIIKVSHREGKKRGEKKLTLSFQPFTHLQSQQLLAGFNVSLDLASHRLNDFNAVLIEHIEHVPDAQACRRERRWGKKKKKRLLECAQQAQTPNIKSRQRLDLFPKRQIPLITVH